MRAPALLLLAGCIVDLRALDPFPCAVDRTCPEGFSCTRLGCVELALGVPCQPPSNDEQTDMCMKYAHPTGIYSCLEGVCTKTCNSSCSNGGECARAGGSKVCLLRCRDAMQGDFCETGARCDDQAFCVADDGGVLPDAGVTAGTDAGADAGSIDAGTVDAGLTIPDGGLLVFVTNDPWTGNLKSVGAATGVAGGDLFCMQQADAGQLRGRFIALLNTSSLNGTTRLPSDGRWFLAGTLEEVFGSRAQLAAQPNVAIERTQFGTLQTTNVWTGSASYHCNSWASESSTFQGIQGQSNVPSRWLVGPTNGGRTNCNTASSLYCFEVP